MMNEEKEYRASARIDKELNERINALVLSNQEHDRTSFIINACLMYADYLENRTSKLDELAGSIHIVLDVLASLLSGETATFGDHYTERLEEAREKLAKILPRG